MKKEKIQSDKVKDFYWRRELNLEEVSKKMGVSVWSLYNFMLRNDIPRRSPSEANYISNKGMPKFKLKENLSIHEEKLKIAGIMLYWAEGTLKGNTVDFVNSSPEMIQIFLKFLREICGVNEGRLRVYLYAYACQDIEEIRLYWTMITKVPLKQFLKPYIRNNNPNLGQRKLPYGLVHVRYNDAKLLETIRDWIKEYTESVLIWAGTQVAKGGRLSKGSVLLKGRM